MAKTPKPPFRVRWKFDDGEDLSLPDDEVQRQLKEQHLSMASSTDDSLRDIGRRYFDRISAMVVEVAREKLDASRRNKRTGPRRKRGKTPQTMLIERGLACVRRDYPDITASKLGDILDAERRLPFEDDDLELRPNGDSILIRDLNTGATAKVRVSSLRAYLNKSVKLSDR